jgi:hypothetical protein
MAGSRRRRQTRVSWPSRTHAERHSLLFTPQSPSPPFDELKERKRERERERGKTRRLYPSAYLVFPVKRGDEQLGNMRGTDRVTI